MEKLLNLLNEHYHTYADYYDDTGREIPCKFYAHADQCFLTVEEGKIYDSLVDDVVISKRFGFIKWLFENDKLDEEELQLTLCDELKRFYKDYEILIMQLSISDNPIEDLIKLLK